MSSIIRPETYAVWSKNEEIRYCSTSGGAFSEIAKYIFKMKGVISGAHYDANNMVEHILISDENELKQIRQSKYLSSRMGNIYIEIKEKLDEGRLVCFCGSPCQVAGLLTFLKKKYDNLITIDFICRGMNSPKAYRAWLDEIEKEEKNRVKRVWFKYKEGGWKTSPKRTRLDFVDGRIIIKSGEENLFMHGYLTSNLYIRPCCGKCLFKGLPRKSDITLADFWGIEEELDDDKGVSLLLINSESGKKIFNAIRENLVVHKKDFDKILQGNPMFDKSVSVPVDSYYFLKDLDTLPFSKCLRKYTRKSIWRRVVRKLERKRSL